MGLVQHSDCAAASPLPENSTAREVESILSASGGSLDYAEAKLRLDALADPSLDLSAARRELDRLSELALAMAGPNADDAARMGALRRLIYQPGPWNAFRPFHYDPDDPDTRTHPAGAANTLLRLGAR
jgi:hypothetical protein